MAILSHNPRYKRTCHLKMISLPVSSFLQSIVNSLHLHTTKTLVPVCNLQLGETLLKGPHFFESRYFKWTNIGTHHFCRTEIWGHCVHFGTTVLLLLLQCTTLLQSAMVTSLPFPVLPDSQSRSQKESH